MPGFEILGELGRGGMGVVYQSRQVALQRTAALRMVLNGAHAGPKELARLASVAASWCKPWHPQARRAGSVTRGLRHGGTSTVRYTILAENLVDLDGVGPDLSGTFTGDGTGRAWRYTRASPDSRLSGDDPEKNYDGKVDLSNCRSSAWR